MSNKMLEVAGPGTLIEQLGLSASQFDVFRCLREVAQSYGFRYFSVNMIPRESKLRLSETVVITSAPSDLVKRHDEFDHCASNPVADRMRRTGMPFEVRFDGTVKPELERIQKILREFDLSCWVVVPVFTPGHGEAAVSFLGQRDPVTATELGELTLLSAVAQERLSQVSAKRPAPTSPLTERELECLVWTAAGKTSVEIAKILSLSEHTVNHYLNNATRKSGTVNRTQTVAYAIRNGWIQ